MLLLLLLLLLLLCVLASPLRAERTQRATSLPFVAAAACLPPSTINTTSAYHRWQMYAFE